jgi:hypothetical protein
MLRQLFVWWLLYKICICGFDWSPATAQNKVANQSAEKRNQPDEEALQNELIIVVLFCKTNDLRDPQLINKEQCKDKRNELRVAH